MHINKTQKLQIRTEASEYQLLQKVAKERNMSMSKLIREYIKSLGEVNEQQI